MGRYAFNIDLGGLGGNGAALRLGSAGVFFATTGTYARRTQSRFQWTHVTGYVTGSSHA